jgi:site-specific DNA recombinase
VRTALGYGRISKDEEGSVSLDYQQAEIRKLAMAQGLRLTGIELDNGISGKAMGNRPGLQAVLATVDAQAVDAVLVYKSDRLSRDGMDSLQIEKLCLLRGVTLLSATEGTLTNDSVDDEFMRFIRAGLNQRERKLISLRTRQALQRKREKGERVGGRPAYGWKVVRGELVEDLDEQEVIGKVQRLHAQGYSTREIVETLRADGAVTRKGTHFTQTQVVRLLKAA